MKLITYKLKNESNPTKIGFIIDFQLNNKINQHKTIAKVDAIRK